MTTPKTVIKKYGNRRLYDTSASSYVNVDDVARMIREGQDVQVVDAQSGEDLTRLVLTQIILDDARKKKGGLPIEFLRQLVVASDRAVQDVLTGYLGAMGEAVRRAQDVVAARRETGWSPIAAMQHLMDPRRAMDPSTWFGGPWAGQQPAPSPGQEPGAEPAAPPEPEQAHEPAAPATAAKAAAEEPPPEPPTEPRESPEAALADQLAAMRAQLEALEQRVAGDKGSE